MAREGPDCSDTDLRYKAVLTRCISLYVNFLFFPFFLGQTAIVDLFLQHSRLQAK